MVFRNVFHLMNGVRWPNLLILITIALYYPLSFVFADSLPWTGVIILRPKTDRVDPVYGNGSGTIQSLVLLAFHVSRFQSNCFDHSYRWYRYKALWLQTFLPWERPKVKETSGRRIRTRYLHVRGPQTYPLDHRLNMVISTAFSHHTQGHKTPTADTHADTTDFFYLAL